MKRISILDCTLRDGGYINRWHFGSDAISGIIELLDTAGIDIIECGFLRDQAYDHDKTVFSDVNQIVPFISPKKPGVLYVGMIALGDISPEQIAPYDGSSIDGIRLTFHKHEWGKARKTAVELMEKGYKVFIQPVGTTSYSDEELLRLVGDVNSLHPFAFYLVDTLGIMYRHDVLRFFYFIDHNLDSDIRLGFHSHNNLQVSFANAQELLLESTKRQIIIDTSVYGMGRGVGNLPTELLTEFINVNVEQRYAIMPLLTIADQYLMSIYAETPWGYALPYYLSAKEHCHPNYAAYLINKETLNIEAISKVLSMLPVDQSDLYHQDLIEKLYDSFQSCQIDDTAVCAALTEKVSDREALILGPGATISSYSEMLQNYISVNHPYVVSVNFIPDTVSADALFISNQKRLDLLKNYIGTYPNVIATSNLLNELPTNVQFVNYTDYLGEGHVGDNAGAMLIRLLCKCGASRILLAGFDGFGTNVEDNYCIPSYKRMLDKVEADKKNADISRQLRLALGGIPYASLTPSRYDI